jgi:hypothetical protein
MLNNDNNNNKLIPSNGVIRENFEHFSLLTFNMKHYINQFWFVLKVCKGYLMASPKKFHRLFARCQTQKKSILN